MAFKGFAQGLLSGDAFSAIEAELDSAINDKDGDGGVTPQPERPPSNNQGSTTTAEANLSASASVSDVEALARISKLEAKLAEKTELCAAKDAQIKLTLAEGEELSIKQMEQEKLIKKLKVQARDAQQSADALTEELSATKLNLASATELLSSNESAVAGMTAEMRTKASAASEAREAERAAEQAEYQALRLKHDALAEEHRALGLSLAQAEARDAMAAEVLRQVQVENARLLDASRIRDAGLSDQLAESSARTASAEEHAQQLAASMDRATQPFRRQVLQVSASFLPCLALPCHAMLALLSSLSPRGIFGPSLPHCHVRHFCTDERIESLVCAWARQMQKEQASILAMAEASRRSEAELKLKLAGVEVSLRAEEGKRKEAAAALGKVTAELTAQHEVRDCDLRCLMLAPERNALGSHKLLLPPRSSVLSLPCTPVSLFAHTCIFVTLASSHLCSQATELERITAEDAAAKASDAAAAAESEIGALRNDCAALAVRVEDAEAAQAQACEDAARSSEKLEEAEKLRKSEGAKHDKTVADLRSALAREEAKSAAALAGAAMARGELMADGRMSPEMDRGPRASMLSSGANHTPTAVREMAGATARQQQGELAAVRRQLERAERQQQLLLEQLTAERQVSERAAGELSALRQLAANYGTMRAQHAAALEMLGEKEEELDAVRASIG